MFKIKNAWMCQKKILPSNVTSETVVQSVLICYFLHTQRAQMLVSIYRTVCVTTKKIPLILEGMRDIQILGDNS